MVQFILLMFEVFFSNQFCPYLKIRFFFSRCRKKSFMEFLPLYIQYVFKYHVITGFFYTSSEISQEKRYSTEL